MENLSLYDKNDKSERMIAIIYHYPCYDGSYAAVNAYCYYAYFCIHKNNIVKFFPSNSQNRINEVELKKFKKVYILDKGLNEEDLEYVYDTANKNKQIKFIVIDHHISSIDYFEDNYKEKFATLTNVKIIFDKTETRSACGITFEYFKKKSEKYTNESNSYIYGEAYKKLNDYVEDSDIGSFSMDYSHEFKSGLSSYITPLKAMADFNKSFHHLDTFYEVDVESCIRFGEKSYKKYKRNAISEISGTQNWIIELKDPNSTDKWKFIVCWSNNKQYRNHACPILSEISLNMGMSPIGAFIYFCEKDIYKISMRSHLKETDVGHVCQIFGGGGHRSAAAFAKSKAFFDELLVNKIDLNKELKKYK